MKIFTATAVREDRWWVVDVDGVGVTQGRSTTEAQRMAVDLVSISLEIPSSEFEVSIDFVAPDDLSAEVEAARAATAAAAKAQQDAAAMNRGVVARLIGAGLSKQDVARVLGVAPQRVSQLSNSQ